MSYNHHLEIASLVFVTEMKFLTYNEDKTVYNVYPQLCDVREENLDSLLCGLEAEDSSRHILQSPIYTKLENVAYPLEQQTHQPLVILQSPIYTKKAYFSDANRYVLF